MNSPLSVNTFLIFSGTSSAFIFSMASLLSGLTGNVSTGVSLVVVTGSVDEEASDSPGASFLLEHATVDKAINAVRVSA